MSDLIRALSDLCIQAYQQLLSITEKRLHNIIGAVDTGCVCALPSTPLFFSYCLFSPLSCCFAGERDHSRSVGIYGEAGDIQKAFWLRPQASWWWGPNHDNGAEGAGSPPHSFGPSSSAPDADRAGLSPAHPPHLCFCHEQPPAAEGHVLLEPWHPDSVVTPDTDTHTHLLFLTYYLCDFGGQSHAFECKCVNHLLISFSFSWHKAIMWACWRSGCGAEVCCQGVLLQH